MAQVLTEAFGAGDATASALTGAPIAHGLDVVVHAVVLAQPVALAGMAGEHRPLGREGARDVDVEVRGHRAAVAVDARERVDEVEVRDARNRRGGFVPAGLVVRRRCRKARICYQDAGGFMVAMVVCRGSGQDDFRGQFTN